MFKVRTDIRFQSRLGAPHDLLPTTWTLCHVIHNINHVTKRLTPSHHHLIKIPNRKLVHANKFSILRPLADHPLLVWPLFLLKSEYLSFVPSRKNTRQMNIITGATSYSKIQIWTCRPEQLKALSCEMIISAGWKFKM